MKKLGNEDNEDEENKDEMEEKDIKRNFNGRFN